MNVVKSENLNGEIEEWGEMMSLLIKYFDFEPIMSFSNGIDL